MITNNYIQHHRSFKCNPFTRLSIVDIIQNLPIRRIRKIINILKEQRNNFQLDNCHWYVFFQQKLFSFPISTLYKVKQNESNLEFLVGI